MKDNLKNLVFRINLYHTNFSQIELKLDQANVKLSRIKIHIINYSHFLQIVQDNPLYHNTHGYQSVQEFPYTDVNVEIILNAWQELAYKLVDVNVNNQLGVMNLQTTTANGTRQSTNGAFIRPIRREHKNLTIKTEAYVTRLFVHPKRKRVLGIEYA